MKEILFLLLLCSWHVESEKHCEDVDSVFMSSTDMGEAGFEPPCRCFQPSSIETPKDAHNEETRAVWIGCSGRSMPSVFRALNSINNTAVSRLVIWDSLINILPSDMFSKVAPESLTIESSSVSVFRKGAFSKIGTKLKELKLSRNIVKSIDKLIFSEIGELESLDFSKNKISLISKGNFESLSKLGKLVLSGNHITRVDDDAFKGLESLLTLDLSENKLEALSRNAFRGLNKLEVLYLQGNQLTNVDPATFSQLPSLKILNLGKNDLSMINVNGLMNLKRLFLNNNNFGNMKDVSLRNLPSLEVLSLDHNSIKGVDNSGLEGLGSSTRLAALSLSENLLSWIGSEAFVNFPLLSTLSLQNNRLVSFNESLFFSLSRLRNLFLSNNRIEHISDEFRGLYNLATLALDHNHIERIDQGAFDGLKLKKLFLNSNKLFFLPEGLFKSFDVDKLLAIDLSVNRWECICGKEWLGDWLQSIGSANVAVGSLGCLRMSCEKVASGDDESGQQAHSWMIYLAVLLFVITLISMGAIGYLIMQESNRSQRPLFGALRRVPSDMVHLIPERLSFPNPVSILSSDCPKSGADSGNEDSFPPERRLTNDTDKKKHVRFDDGVE